MKARVPSTLTSLFLLPLGATPLEVSLGSTSLLPPAQLAPSWQSLSSRARPGQTQSRPGAWSLGPGACSLRPGAGRRGPQARPGALSGPPPTRPQPLSSRHTDHISPSPQLSSGSLQPGGGAGGGERCLIAAGERHRELKIQSSSKAPPPPGGPEEFVGGGLAGTHKDPNIPVNRCSLGTQPAFPSSLFPSLGHGSSSMATPTCRPPSFPGPSHRNSSPSRNRPPNSTISPAGVSSSPSGLQHGCSLLSSLCFGVQLPTATL